MKSFTERLRAAGANPAVRSETRNAVSGGLRSQLGEELAAMLEKVGRKVYAAAMERTQQAIAESLMAHRPVLAASLRAEFGRRGAANAKRAVAEWLDEVIGEVLTDVAEEVYKDLPDVAEALVDEVEAMEGEEDEVDTYQSDDDEEPDEEVVDDEEEMPEGGGLGEPALASDEGLDEPGELQAIADELEEIKAAGMAQAARLAAAGDPDSAAFCRMVMDQL